MDGTGEHYAKWNKPGGEGQLPYDLTYKVNIINKTNKEAKYNQSHWNKEQTDSDQRGGGRGIIGDNRVMPSRNMYQEHMDKAKVGSEWVQGWEAEMGGMEAGGGGVKMETIVLEQQ